MHQGFAEQATIQPRFIKPGPTEQPVEGGPVRGAQTQRQQALGHRVAGEGEQLAEHQRHRPLVGPGLAKGRAVRC